MGSVKEFLCDYLLGIRYFRQGCLHLENSAIGLSGVRVERSLKSDQFLYKYSASQPNYLLLQEFSKSGPGTSSIISTMWKLLEILRPHARPRNLWFNKWFWCTLTFENHCSTLCSLLPFPPFKKISLFPLSLFRPHQHISYVSGLAAIFLKFDFHYGKFSYTQE